MPPCHQVPPLQGLVAQGSWLAQLGQGSQSPMSAKTTAWPPMVPWPLEQDPVIKQGFSTALSLPWVPNPPAQAGDEVWSPSALCSGALGPAVSVGETIPSNSIQTMHLASGTLLNFSRNQAATLPKQFVQNPLLISSQFIKSEGSLSPHVWWHLWRPCLEPPPPRNCPGQCVRACLTALPDPVLCQ